MINFCYRRIPFRIANQKCCTNGDLLLLSSDSPNDCATEVLKTWRDKKESEANMANLEKALRDMGRPDIADNFKKLAYSSYSQKPLQVVTTHRVTTYAESPDGTSANRRISEFLDSASDVDGMFLDDTLGSPTHDYSRATDQGEVFTVSQTVKVESSPEQFHDSNDETVIMVQKRTLVDQDGNVIEESQTISQDGNDVTNDREKLIQDFLGDDKGVLDFFSSDAEKSTVRSGESSEETEI